MPRAYLLALLLVLAGCAGAPTDTPTTTPTPAPVPSPGSPTATPQSASVTAGWALAGTGAAFEDFRSLNVTVRSVVFKHGTPDQCHGRVVGPNATLAPTTTPDMDRDVDCVIFRRNRTVDLRAPGPVVLGNYTVPSHVAGTTYLVVDPQNGTLQSGEHVRFDPQDPGFVAEPTTERIEGRTIHYASVAVVERSGEYRVSSDSRVSGYDVSFPADYAVTVEGRVATDDEVTVRYRENGSAANATIEVGGESYVTGPDGEVTVPIEHPAVFEVTVVRP